MLPRTLAIAAVLAFGSAAFAQSPPTGSPKELVVYPAEVKLSGPRDEQRLVVLGVWADGRKFDLTRSATVTTSDAKIATADRGVVRPVGDGSTTLTVEANGAKASVPVTAEKTAADIPVSFSREIEPI